MSESWVLQIKFAILNNQEIYLVQKKLTDVTLNKVYYA